MKDRGWVLFPAVALGLTVSAGCSRQATSTAAAEPRAPASAGGGEGAGSSASLSDAKLELGALPAPEAAQPELVALGRRAFFETGASADGTVGCVSCHLPEHWGADGRDFPVGVFGRLNPRNSPTVFNAGGQTSQHWRGDRESLEQQASRALLGAVSFGNASEGEATERLNAIGWVAGAFAQVFPDDPAPVSIQNWGLAIAAYERSLVTPAPFDAWLGGDAVALDPEAQHGLRLFLDVGCSSCHDGALLGGRALEKFGRERDYWPLTHSAKVDAGRFDVTKDEADRYVFKVAALRNVARTAPYFHDGSVATLPEAVDIMAQTQLGKDLPADERDAIVAFLETLTGSVPQGFAAPPAASSK